MSLNDKREKHTSPFIESSQGFMRALEIYQNFMRDFQHQQEFAKAFENSGAREGILPNCLAIRTNETCVASKSITLKKTNVYS